MYIVTIRTDKPEAELGLYDGSTQLACVVWGAHRALATTLHAQLLQLLASQQMGLADIEGLVVYKGPGSFTGLRIGIAAANAFAYSLHIPIVSEAGSWIEQGAVRLAAGENEQVALPTYGAPAFTTTPKK